MKTINKYITIVGILLVSLLILGILSSFINFGLVSVFFSVFLPFIFILNVIFAFFGLYRKKYYYLIGVVLFIVCFNFFLKVSLKKTNQISPDNISILSYNVRGFNSDKDIIEQGVDAKIINFIERIDSDIIVLQEVEYKKSRNIKNYPYIFFGYRSSKVKSLLAIYSKYPILSKGYIDFPNTVNNAIYADIKIKQDTIRIYNLHFQSYGVELNSAKNNNYKYTRLFSKINQGIFMQIQQAEMVKNEINKCIEKVVICGDFNSTQFSLPYRILKNGLNDSFIIKGNGLGSTYTLFNYPLRLDFILADIKIEIVAHENFYLNLSDHEPVLVNFKI